MAVIPGFPISALFENPFYPISALFRIPSGTVPTARLHQTPIPTILQINGKTSRGDPAGFVQLLDDKTLLLPERRGNNRADSLRNIALQERGLMKELAAWSKRK